MESAFSGGVDSSLALAVTVRVLPKGRVLAVTSNNETYLPSELEGAKGLARFLGVEHLVVNTRELEDPNYAKNPSNRCYFCKSTLYLDLAKVAEEKGYACVVDGANKDDEGDYRPGRKAAKELGVFSPLSAAGMGKAEVPEEFMRRQGYKQVRVRHHGEIARLEVGPDELERAFRDREKISAELRAAGFLYVTLDLAGYQPGSLNAALKQPSKKILPVVY